MGNVRSPVPRLRRAGWLAAGTVLVLAGIAGVVAPVFLSGGLAIAVVALALLLTGVAVIRGIAGARILGFSVSALGAIVTGYVATTPLRGLRPPEGQSVSLDAGTVLAACALAVIALLILTGTPRPAERRLAGRIREPDGSPIYGPDRANPGRRRCM